MDLLKMYLLLKMVIFHCHVSLQYWRVFGKIKGILGPVSFWLYLETPRSSHVPPLALSLNQAGRLIESIGENKHFS